MAHGEFREAQTHYARAAAYVGPTMPRYTAALLNAGKGYCALQLGDLSEARRCEKLLGPLPDEWYFDPTAILQFKTAMLSKRRDLAGANELLDRAAESLEERLVLAWFKIRMLQVRTLTRAGEKNLARDIALACRERAQRLGLLHRQASFDGFLATLGQ